MTRHRFDYIPGPSAYGLVEVRSGLMVFPRHDAGVSRVLALMGEWSQAELDLMVQYLSPGDSVIEVGAHIGSLTLPLAKCVGPSGKVLAFEPQGFLADILRSNALLNHQDHVEVHVAAVSDGSGEIAIPEFNYAGEDANYGAVALPEIQNLHAHHPTTLRPVVTLDSLGLADCRLLKVDAETMEPQILRGALDLIRRCRPVLYVECDRPEGGAPLKSVLDEIGYQRVVASGPGLQPRQFRWGGT